MVGDRPEAGSIFRRLFVIRSNAGVNRNVRAIGAAGRDRIGPTMIADRRSCESYQTYCPFLKRSRRDRDVKVEGQL